MASCWLQSQTTLFQNPQTVLTAVDASSFQPNPALLPSAGCDRRLETDLTGEAGVSQRAVALLYLMCLLALFGGSSFLRHCQADLWDAGGERDGERRSSQCHVRTPAIHSFRVGCQSKSQVSGELHKIFFSFKTSDNSKHLLLFITLSHIWLENAH